ncbi:hypothetical protein REPUB_Repub06bG0114300 [Reevesia pubescens]
MNQPLLQLQPNLRLSTCICQIPHLTSNQTSSLLYSIFVCLSAKMAAEAVFRRGPASTPWQQSSSSSTNQRPKTTQLLHFTIRVASHSINDKNRAFKQLGLFSLKKKIEDVILRAEMLAPTALELEEARRIKQEKLIRDYDLWDDPVKSNEILVKLADSVKVVNALKDLKYKAEEAKLITQLAEIDAVNYSLFEQAYDASLVVSDLLDKYEVSKLLRGPYDMEGACVIIKAGSGGNKSEVGAEQLLRMYIKWAKKQGYRGRVVEKKLSTNGGIKSATIEFEFENTYGFLSGERGVHFMIRSSRNGSVHNEASLLVPF